MEHFSRLTTKDIDLLLVVSDPSRRGMLSARRICDLVDELGIRVGRRFLVIKPIPGRTDKAYLARV